MARLEEMKEGDKEKSESMWGGLYLLQMRQNHNEIWIGRSAAVHVLKEQTLTIP